MNFNTSDDIAAYIISGPEFKENPSSSAENDEYLWWKLHFPDGSEGWVADHFITPYGLAITDILVDPQSEVSAGQDIDIHLQFNQQLTRFYGIEMKILGADGYEKLVDLGQRKLINASSSENYNTTWMLRNIGIPSNTPPGFYELKFNVWQDDGDGIFESGHERYEVINKFPNRLFVDGITPGATGGGGSDLSYSIDFWGIHLDDDNSGGSSGNDDGIVNPGETVEISIDLENDGEGSIENVEVILSSEDSFVEITDHDIDFGGIDPGTRKTYKDFDVIFREDTPDGHQVHFELKITSDQGVWRENYTIAVSHSSTDIKPNIRLGRTSVNHRAVVPGGSFTFKQEIIAEAKQGVLLSVRALRMEDNSIIPLLLSSVSIAKGRDTLIYTVNVPLNFTPTLHGILVELWQDLNEDDSIDVDVDRLLVGRKVCPFLVGSKCRVTEFWPPPSARVGFPATFIWSLEGGCDSYCIVFKRAETDQSKYVYSASTSELSIDVTASDFNQIASLLGSGTGYFWAIAERNIDTTKKQIISAWSPFMPSSNDGPTFQGWQSSLGSQGLQDTTLAGNTDGDELSNLEEYAYRTDAFKQDESPVRVYPCKLRGKTYLCIAFPRRRYVTDIVYTIQASRTLIDDWYDANKEYFYVTPPIPSNDGLSELITLRSAHPISETQAKFLRVAVVRK